MKNFNLVTVENHWDLLLRDCAKIRERETKQHHSHNFVLKPIMSNKQNTSYVK